MSHAGPPRRRTAAFLDLVRRRPVVAVVVLATLVRCALAVPSFMRGGVLLPDELTYLRLAAAVASGRGAEAYQEGYGQTLYDTTWVFSSPLAFLFELFGPTRLSGQLLAVAWGVAAAALTVWIARCVAPPLWAAAAGAVVAVWPSQVLWSSTVLRESAVWTALALAGVGLTLAARRPGSQALPGLAIATTGLLALGFLRDQTAVAATWAFAAAAVAVAVQWRRPLLVGAAGLALVAIPYVGGTGVAGWELAKRALPNLGATRTGLALDAESAFRPAQPFDPGAASATASSGPGAGPSGPGAGPADNSDAAGNPTAEAEPAETPTPAFADEEPPALVFGSGGEAFVVDNSVSGSLSSLPQGLVAVTLRPFLWEPSSSAGSLLARLENVGWYALYAFSLIGMWVARRRLDVIAFPVAATGAIVAVAAVTQGNLGTAFRHRGQLLWALAVLAVIGMHWAVTRRGGPVLAPAELPRPERTAPSTSVDGEASGAVDAPRMEMDTGR